MPVIFYSFFLKPKAAVHVHVFEGLGDSLLRVHPLLDTSDYSLSALFGQFDTYLKGQVGPSSRHFPSSRPKRWTEASF